MFEKRSFGRKSERDSASGEKRDESPRGGFRRRDDDGGGFRRREETDRGGFSRREGGSDRKEGFGRNNGFQRREGGERSDSFQRREGGERSGSFQRRDGDFQRGGGFRRQDGEERSSRGEGFRRNQDDSRSGGFRRSEGGERSGGFTRREGDEQRGGFARREGGFPRRDNNDRGGFSRREGSDRGNSYPRREGSERSGGFQRREGGERSGGFQRRSEGGERSGGFSRREGEEQRGGYPRREGGFGRRDNDGGNSGFRRREDGERSGGFRRRDDGERSGYAGREGGERGRSGRFQRSEGSGRKSFSSDKSRRPRVAVDSPKSFAPDPFDENATIRLNKYIANTGLCSRREADKFIEAGLVTVNGVVISELGVKVLPTDEVRYNNERLNPERKVYLLLNKPKDYVTSVDDPHATRTVMELIEGACKERIYPVGRLDRMTTGVLLFTNDGEMALKLTHPSNDVRKIYQITLDKKVSHEDMIAIASGVELEDGFIQPNEVSYADPEDKHIVGIEIHSGRNRVVRRIFEKFGYKVAKLDRVYFAGLSKKGLTRGKWRFLTTQEVGFLKMLKNN